MNSIKNQENRENQRLKFLLSRLQDYQEFLKESKSISDRSHWLDQVVITKTELDKIIKKHMTKEDTLKTLKTIQLYTSTNNTPTVDWWVENVEF